MKGFVDDANYSVGLLDEGTNLGNVIDNYVNEHTLVSYTLVLQRVSTVLSLSCYSDRSAWLLLDFSRWIEHDTNPTTTIPFE